MPNDVRRICIYDDENGHVVFVDIDPSVTVGNIIESAAAFFEKEPGPYALVNRKTDERLVFGDNPAYAMRRGWVFDRTIPIMGNSRADCYIKNEDEFVLKKDPDG